MGARLAGGVPAGKREPANQAFDKRWLNAMGAPMRRLVLVALATTAAACTTTPKTQPVPPAPTPAPEPVQRSDLSGLAAPDLLQRFGTPGFQVREGAGLKLQWSVPACVLDTYLYPPPSGAGVARVTYVEARRPSGEATDVAGCIAAIDAAG